jgi:hypothetical protein
MKNPNYSIGNRTHNPPACSTVPGKRCIICDVQNEVMLSLIQRMPCKAQWAVETKLHSFLVSVLDGFEMSSSHMAALFLWREANQDSSVVQPAVWSLYTLRSIRTTLDPKMTTRRVLLYREALAKLSPLCFPRDTGMWALRLLPTASCYLTSHTVHVLTLFHSQLALLCD